MMFWTIMSMIFVLLVTGVIIWRPYFAEYFPIPVIRYSLLIHATSAIILIHAILIHMYMAFWVKGSINGMIEARSAAAGRRNITRAGIAMSNAWRRSKRVAKG